MDEENKPQGNTEWLKTYGLSLEDVVPCDTVECTRPATHFTKRKCCGSVVLVCEECLSTSLQLLMELIQSKTVVRCEFCRKHNNPYGWLSKPEVLQLDFNKP